MGGGAARVGGIGGAGAIVVFLLAMFLGVDPSQLLGPGGMDGGISSSAPVELTEEDRQEGEFVSVVLADTEEIWTRVFQEQLGQPYRPATLVLFKEATRSACGSWPRAGMTLRGMPSSRAITLDLRAASWAST